MPRRLATVALTAALALPSGAWSAPKPPRWQVLADCAAAYQANAQVADPDRPAAMVAQISDVARDYITAAERAYHPRPHGPSARRVVAARVSAQTRVYGARPREAVEAVIDACPQVGG